MSWSWFGSIRIGVLAILNHVCLCFVLCGDYISPRRKLLFWQAFFDCVSMCKFWGNLLAHRGIPFWSQFKEEGRRHAETRAVQLGNLLAAINLMETRNCFRPFVFQWVSGNDLGNLLATIGQELNWQRSEEAGYAFKAVYQFRSLQTCKPVHRLLSKGLGASFYTYNGKTAVHTGMSTAVLNLIPWNADARAAWCR